MFIKSYHIICKNKIKVRNEIVKPTSANDAEADIPIYKFSITVSENGIKDQ